MNKLTKVRIVHSELRETMVPYGGSKISNAKAAYELVKVFIENEPQEVFSVLLLDGKQKLISYAEITKGTLNASLVHPREVFRTAIAMNAAAIILAHNHPSGDPLPSQEDIYVTKRLKESGEILGIPVQDHIIVGHGSFYSFKDSEPSFRGY